MDNKLRAEIVLLLRYHGLEWYLSDCRLHSIRFKGSHSISSEFFIMKNHTQN